MNIVFHCVYFPPEVGGLESHVHQLAKGLVERGHEVSVVTSRSRPGLADDEVVDGIRVLRTVLPTRTPVGWTVHALGSLPATWRLARKADIVHAQGFSSVLPCVVATNRRRTPLVATLHTSHFLRRARMVRWRPVLRWLVRRPSYCLAASEEIAAVTRTLARDSRVEALTNGVDTELFRPVPPELAMVTKPRLVVPRRLFPKNGVEHFVRAVPSVAEAFPDVDVVVIGDGPERGRIEALIDELDVGDRVHLLGSRPHAEMPGLLCSGDLAVFPSLMEATSVAALECMACAVPVAASRVGGLPEIVDESVGGLFEPGDPEDLARCVVDLLRSGDLEERGRRARERVVERWSNDRLVDRHLAIYAGLREEL